MPNCLEYAEEHTQQCDRWEDDGYNACVGWHPWFRWICVSWTWMQHFVCVSWVVVTTVVCVVWDVVVTVVAFVVELLESLAIGWILNILAMYVELVLSIPYVGALVRWVFAIGRLVLWTVVALLDAVASLVGIRPEKKLRVCTIILRDENDQPVAAVADVVNALNDAIQILYQEANVQLLNSAPFQFTSGAAKYFGSGPILADASWVRIYPAASATRVLDVACGGQAAIDDLGEVGTNNRIRSFANCWWGNWRRVLGYGGPVVIFILRSIRTGSRDDFGCSLGPLSDYVTIAGGTPTVLDGAAGRPMITVPHELGHACTLWHVENPLNLMDADGIDAIAINLDHVQATVMRASTHVTYL